MHFRFIFEVQPNSLKWKLRNRDALLQTEWLFPLDRKEEAGEAGPSAAHPQSMCGSPDPVNKLVFRKDGSSWNEEFPTENSVKPGGRALC